ncbi:hypothetical protein GCM10025789_08390 [Tessaracoccus lubricantis]|uniref:Uncharacterized protein n=1 Tax=Tessaracoccus lubricantis TaxID=545543 RepID=A0ABP9FD80_9ACTN
MCPVGGRGDVGRGGMRVDSELASFMPRARLRVSAAGGVWADTGPPSSPERAPSGDYKPPAQSRMIIARPP